MEYKHLFRTSYLRNYSSTNLNSANGFHLLLLACCTSLYVIHKRCSAAALLADIKELELHFVTAILYPHACLLWEH